MSKSYFLLFSILLGLMFIGGISAVNIGYVVVNPSNLNSDEIAVKNILESKDNLVTFLDDVSFDANLYDIILISERVNSIENLFDNRYFKTLFMNPVAAKKQGFSSGSGRSSGRRIVISNNESSVTEEFSLGDLNVYPSQSEIKYLVGCKPINSESLAYKSDTYNSILLLLDKDSLLLDGSCTKRDKKIYERNLFFGLSETSKWNSDAETLFLNSLDWLLEGDDKDEDGYDSSEDCNDNDASIHPDAVEILDDIDQNCVNDAPIFEGEIQDLNWEVNQDLVDTIDLNDYFKDTDGDGLSFDVYDTSENENITVHIANGLISFESILGWTGEDWIVFQAVDDSGLMTISNMINLSVVDVVNPVDTSCSGLGGFICSSEETCLGEWLVDGSCCSIECTNKYVFNEIDRLELNEDIEIEIRTPEEEADVEVGENMGVNVIIYNKVENDLKFDVDVYLYDLTNGEIIEDGSDSIKIDKTEKKTLIINLDIPEDLDENNEYVIFARVEDRNGEYYNEDYNVIDIVREKKDVVIDNIVIDGEAKCGNYLDVKVKAYNIGKEKQDVYIKLKILDLDIEEKSEKFSLEKYDEKDTASKTFRIKIPKDTRRGEYVMTAAVFFGGKSHILDKKIVINCEGQEIVDVPSKTLDSLNPIKVSKDRTFGLGEGFLIWSFVVLVVLVFVMVGFKFRR